jgi:hypothetical protein
MSEVALDGALPLSDEFNSVLQIFRRETENFYWV